VQTVLNMTIVSLSFSLVPRKQLSALNFPVLMLLTCCTFLSQSLSHKARLE
jgi:hypothetical protein